MYFTLLGITMLVSPLHPEKALSPMLVTLSGMSMLVSSVQPAKAESPMLVTLPFVGMTLVLQPKISVFVAVSIRQLSEL